MTILTLESIETFSAKVPTEGGALREGWPRSVPQSDASPPLPRDASPSNDTRAHAGDATVAIALESRLRDAIERGPLDTLSGAAATARALADQVSEAHALAMRSIAEAVERTEDMLQEMREFLRGRAAGGVPVERRRTDLKRVCERVLDTIERRHPTQGLKFECDRRVEGDWDPDAISSLLLKLVLNAIEHATVGSLIRVSLRALEDRAVLEVCNAGEVRSELALHQLFEPFANDRLGPSGVDYELGLRLYLASQIARAHHGRIEAESDARRGTIFRVDLPRH